MVTKWKLSSEGSNRKYDAMKLTTAILAGACSALLLCGCATNSARIGALPNVPEIQPPKGQVFAFSLRAKGIQIYECQARKDDATQFEWSFKAPEADLFDRRGRKAGTHYKGPTWESKDGSRVVGETPRFYPADSNSIPWLLLRVVGQQTGPAGGTALSGALFIQRVNTAGGQAPPTGCSNAHDIGRKALVPYATDYVFYK